MTQTSTDRIEKRIELDAPVSRVWQAITDYHQFSEWFGVKMDSPFVAGKKSSGIANCGGKDVVMNVHVEQIVPESLLSFKWRPNAIDPDADYSGEPMTLVEFRLESQGEGTILKVTESGFDAIPESRRDEAFRNNSGGWTAQMKNIESYVSNNP